MKTGKTGWLIRGAMVSAAAFAVAAAPGAAKNAQAQAAPILTEETRGFVSVGVGVPVEIRLRSQGGTGFSWVPTRLQNLVTEKKTAKHSQAMPGSAQVQRFRFIAPKRGTYRLIFSYDQPWSGGTKGAKTKGFVIVAR